MWVSPAVSLSALSLAAQAPLEPRLQPHPSMSPVAADDFAFKQGADILSPIDLVKLAHSSARVFSKLQGAGKCRPPQGLDRAMRYRWLKMLCVGDGGGEKK